MNFETSINSLIKLDQKRVFNSQFPLYQYNSEMNEFAIASGFAYSIFTLHAKKWVCFFSFFSLLTVVRGTCFFAKEPRKSKLPRSTFVFIWATVDYCGDPRYGKQKEYFKGENDWVHVSEHRDVQNRCWPRCCKAFTIIVPVTLLHWNHLCKLPIFFCRSCVPLIKVGWFGIFS